VDHEQLLIADTPDQWVEAIDELIGNATLRDELGRNGRKHAENFHNQRIIEKLIGFYKSLQR
jgi:glycosyltransferase involved in cell wall biosynthesis